MDNKSLCLLPWVHLEIQPDGKVLTCCKAQGYPEIGNLHQETLKDIWNQSSIKKIRQSMLLGEELEQCTACRNQEVAGGVSDRQLSFYQYPEAHQKLNETQPDGSLHDFDISYLGLRFSNVCNLTCRMCGPSYSTSWFENQHHLSYLNQETKVLEPARDFEHLWSEVESLIQGVRRVYIAGGEPLLAKQHYQFLKKLIELGRVDIELIYNSNLTHLNFGNKDVLHLWNQFDRITVSASIDALGDKGEYIRHGSQWSEVLKNINKIKSHAPKVLFNLYPTVQALNALHLVDLLDYFLENNYLKPTDIRLNILESPSFLSMQILPHELKEQLSQKIYSFLKKKVFPKYELSEFAYLKRELQSVLNYAYKEDTSHMQNEFRAFHQNLDLHWGQDFKKVFPELVF